MREGGRGDVRIPSTRTLAMPADANPNGDIFGGWLMSQMDLAGGVHAAHETGGRVATVAVDAMSFHKPVQVGDQVSCYCATERIGRTSIAVRVETRVRRRHQVDQQEEKVTEGLFTYVALDERGRPRPVEAPTPAEGARRATSPDAEAGSGPEAQGATPRETRR